MTTLKGLKCRECGRHYAAAPIHVCEFCFGPLEVDDDYDRLEAHVKIEPSLSAFDRPLADLKYQISS